MPKSTVFFNFYKQFRVFSFASYKHGKKLSNMLPKSPLKPFFLPKRSCNIATIFVIDSTTCKNRNLVFLGIFNANYHF